MLNRLLDLEQRAGGLQPDVDVPQVTVLLFSGLLGACVLYTSDKSRANLDLTIGALLDHLDRISR